MTIDVFYASLDVIAFLIAIAAGFIIMGTWTAWRGDFRNELLFIAWGFILLSMGFLWQALTILGVLPAFGSVLFLTGITLLFLGSSRILTFTAS